MRPFEPSRPCNRTCSVASSASRSSPGVHQAPVPPLVGEDRLVAPTAGGDLHPTVTGLVGGWRRRGQLLQNACEER
jgi:hypothetical protein